MNKKSILSVVASLIFLAGMSFAQSTPGDQSQGTQGSSPTTQQDPSMGQGSNSGSTAGQGSTSMSQGSEMKGDKKIKGCIRSEGGQYTLEDKHGKTTPLSGQDLSAHVGHEVTVHGMWANGSDSSAASSGSMSNGKTFNVTNVDMISETCSMGKDKSKTSSDPMQK